MRIPGELMVGVIETSWMTLQVSDSSPNATGASFYLLLVLLSATIQQGATCSGDPALHLRRQCSTDRAPSQALLRAIE